MTNLINNRTPEEIKAGLRACTTGKTPGYGCNAHCPYLNAPNCWLPVKADALALIEHLEAKAPKWISVEERLPEDGELVLITMSGKLYERKHFVEAYELATHWSKGEDDEGVYHDGGWDLWDYNDGVVKDFNVFCWMPLPEPPKEENV